MVIAELADGVLTYEDGEWTGRGPDELYSSLARILNGALPLNGPPGDEPNLELWMAKQSIRELGLRQSIVLSQSPVPSAGEPGSVN